MPFIKLKGNDYLSRVICEPLASTGNVSRILGMRAWLREKQKVQLARRRCLAPQKLTKSNVKLISIQSESDRIVFQLDIRGGGRRPGAGGDGTRLRTAAAHIHANFDVDGLCRTLPRRVAALIKAEGGRLAK